MSASRDRAGTPLRGPSSSASATAMAGSNIALVKYWGKRDAALNLPATGSLSLTLDGLGTTTTVELTPAAAEDEVRLDGVPADERAATRVRRFLDLVRARAGTGTRARVLSHNTVPTAAGLASSASAFAALALAATRAFGLELSAARLSELARRGSGSAARSVFGGFAEMARGEQADGSDAVAAPIPAGEGWPVCLVVALCARGPKAVSSSDAMTRTARTSPYYEPWIEANQRDLTAARAAVEAHDLEALGAVAERSALRMHASMMAAEPAVLYWMPATLAVMRTVTGLRAAGVPAFFTIDAGPHVKVLCAADDADRVRDALSAVSGVDGTITCMPGPGAHLIESVVAE